MGRPSKPWYRKDRDSWVCSIDGAQYTLAHGKKNRPDAFKEFHRIQASRGTPGYDPESISLGELIDRFLVDASVTTATLTVDFYFRHLAALQEHLGPQRPARSLRPLHVLDWHNGRNCSQSTRHGAIAACKRLYRWARKVGHLNADYLNGLDRPGIARREVILSPQAEQSALEAVGEDLRDYLGFIHFTGCRPSEAAKLEAGHLDFAASVATLPGKTTRKTNRQRVVYLCNEAQIIVRRRMQLVGEGPLFRNSRGNPWTRNAVSLAMRRARRKLGMGKECTASSFRHGWVTDAKLVLPNSIVAELAGHTSTAMVDRHYGHIHLRTAELAASASQVRGIGRRTVPVSGEKPASESQGPEPEKPPSPEDNARTRPSESGSCRVPDPPDGERGPAVGRKDL